MTQITARITIRKDTAANWTSANPVLSLGEIAEETDTLRTKTGDGTTEWNSLRYNGNPRVTSITSSATPTPNVDTTDQLVIRALSVGATFGAPTGTPVNGQPFVYAVKDNGTSRPLSLNAVFVDLTGSFPSATTVSKWLYFGAKYNSASGKWHILAVVIEP